jgi:6-pyruvoyltetrahydropterin/6-carboxytetrahydropterin synthase
LLDGLRRAASIAAGSLLISRGCKVVRITRSVEFAASLRLRRDELDPEENERLFGERTRQHGHNYRLEVSVRGEPDPRTGMVMDLAALQAVLDREVMARFDHRDLVDDTPFFEKSVPTPENLALVLWELLGRALPAGSLDRIRLHPDERGFVEVSDEDAEA